ncbi:uncharacterized protein LOC111696950 [Eurytemora carolleeae]|uniref:uncharacterized protein LOC111696950 n=1 Tax=Eurytemora carolleeae TaxID=1294199 RepID=UPI000C75FA0F|nr:uncharacterized protein LOC111696950 [Eurytemora carolleeae]|eukprot:XP_023322536.1 uncharacterized protein LOC111696950 [Eurytemora affinis]
MVAIEEAEEDPSTKWIQVPLSPGDSNLGLVEMNPRVVDLANTSGQNINSGDLTKVEEILKTSRPVPLFQALKGELEDILEDGTKNNQSEVQETQLAKMCMIKEEKGLLKYSVSGEEKGLKSISPTPHKVQFLEDEDSRRKYSRSAENIADSRKLGKCSPSKSLCGSSRTPPTGRRRRRRQVSEASSMSVTSVTSESSVGSYSSASPDGGYGWVVVAASFLVNMIADGVTFSFGVMFDEFQGEFDSTKAETAGVVAIFHAVPLLTGPLATWLTDRYGCRKVTIVGAILACIGFLLAAFSHHIVLLYLFFGVIAGFGLSLCYVAAIIIVAYYFDRRRSFATGISVCGSGVGTFLFAPLTQYLMDEYSGWRGACIILAGIFLNMCFCGMLFRELPWTKEMKGRRKSFRSISEMPEIGDLRSALEDGEDLSGFLYNEEDEPRIASSLIDLPTYVKNAAGLPPDVLSMLARNKETYTFIQQNFPDSLIATSISEYGLRSENGFVDKKNDHDRLNKKEESTSVKLVRKVSSLLKKDESRITRPVKQRLEFDGDEEISTFPQGVAKPRDELADESNKELEVLTNRQKFLKTHCLKNLRMRRQSLTCKNRITQGLRSSSCPDILNPVLPDLVSEPGTFS